MNLSALLLARRFPRRRAGRDGFEAASSGGTGSQPTGRGSHLAGKVSQRKETVGSPMAGILDSSTMTGSTWVKSSLSFANGNCVEVSDQPGGTIGVRNSRDREGPVLRFTPDEWQAFLGGVRNGEFDDFGRIRM